MGVKITRLNNLANLNDLVAQISAYQTTNKDLAFQNALVLLSGGTSYTGKYSRFASFDITYQITSPLPVTSNGDLFDVETGWVIDSEGTQAFQVQIIDNNGAVTVQYFDQPGGADITGTIVNPVSPLQGQIAQVAFNELGRGLLVVDDSTAVGLAQCLDPADGVSVIGIPAGAVGAVCFFKGDENDYISFVTTQAPSPTAGGSGIPVFHGDSFNPGINPEEPSGDTDSLTASRFICKTGQSGTYEVIFYESI